MANVLGLLPEDYEDVVGTLTKLFKKLCFYDDIEKLFLEESDLVEICWPVSFVQDMAAHDDAFAAFMCGHWITADGSYYIEFFRKDGGISCQYTLPWVEASGTEYYDIQSGKYVLLDKNSKVLADVYLFEIVDHDTVLVYCYKNGLTYTIYR